MLFNSYIFILVFLPVVVLVFSALKKVWSDDGVPMMAWITFSSFAFYAYWKPSLLPLLIGSIAFNYLVAGCLAEGRERRRMFLVAGISVNLLLLAFFKYAGFITGNVELILGISLPHSPVALPLAISFFTFQQIAFLVDVYKGETEETSFLPAY